MTQDAHSCICFFNTNKAWGGGEKWHLEAASHFHQKGRPVLVVAHPSSELFLRAQNLNIPVEGLSVSNLSFLNPSTLYRVRLWFQSHRVNTLLINLSSDLKVAGIAGRLAGIPNIIYRRGLDKAIKPSALNQWLLTKAVHRILVNSEATKRSVLSGFSAGIGENKVTVIPNGLHFDKYQEQRAASPRPKPHGKVIIGNLGRLSEQKGQVYLIEAAEILKQRGVVFEVWIAGSGELEEVLKKKIRDRGLASHVFLLGFQKEVRGFLESIDIFAFPSLWEGFGYVLAEAGYFEKPVVAFDASSTPEVVEAGKTGLLVEAKNALALADALQQLIKKPETRAQLGSAAKQRVLQHFTFQKSMEQVERLI